MKYSSVFSVSTCVAATVATCFAVVITYQLNSSTTQPPPQEILAQTLELQLRNSLLSALGDSMDNITSVVLSQKAMEITLGKLASRPDVADTAAFQTIIKKELERILESSRSNRQEIIQKLTATIQNRAGQTELTANASFHSPQAPKTTLPSHMQVDSPTPGRPENWCGDEQLFKRSYLMPKRFPFPPIRLVMEKTPGSCDFYISRNFCKMLEADAHFEPEYHVKEVIASFLVGCHYKECMAIDLGANNGWMTAYMLSLGAHVISAEPQADLAGGVRATVELNCWSSRSKVFNAFISADPGANGTKKDGGLWRAGGRVTKSTEKGNSVPMVPLDEVLLMRGNHIHFIKMDADGPEGSWLRRIDQLITEKKVIIDTMVIEAHDCSAELVQRFQQVHGYHTYLLDMHIDQRFLNAKGIDVYSHFKPIEDPPNPWWIEEFYSIRFMRHLYYFKPNMTLSDWEDGILFRHVNDNQYLFTKEILLEPRREHPFYRWPATHSRQQKAGAYKAPKDGLD